MTRSTLLLFPFVTVLLLYSSFATAQTQEKPLTVEGIYAHGPLAGDPPDEPTWSPDGKHLTYMDGGLLMDVDPATGKTHVLVGAAKMAQLQGGNASDRDSDRRSRYKMSSYIWAPDSTHILFDANGRLWLYDLRKGVGFEMGFAGIASGDDPKFSPDASYISFVRDHGLAAVRMRDPGTPTAPLVTVPNSSTGSEQLILNGEVDWVYEEELDVRSNYFWSPDSKNVAFLQMNETAVPQYPLTDWMPRHALVDWQRYPQPGDPNPAVRVGIINARGGKAAWVKLPADEEEDYIPRFGWADNKTVWMETLSRDHKHRRVLFADAAGGDARVVLEIRDEKFMDENYDVIVGGGAIVLTQWEDGHNHVYLYRYDPATPLAGAAQAPKQLTSGDFEVSEVYRVDREHQVVDYASNEGDPLEQQVWRVDFNGTRKQLTAGAGFHEANFAPDGSTFVDSYSTRMQPTLLRICQTSQASTAGGGCHVLWETHALDSYHLHAPEQLQVKAHDGTTLYATLLLPAGDRNPASVPLIVNPYGGPEVQTVVNQWKYNLLFDELLAQHGFAVLHTDNRGMAGRGQAFEQAAYRNLGPVQLEDQLAVVDAVLAQYPQLNAKRLGWWGWSWGGTFTLYALTHSDRFSAGVAVAPVTDWRDYDSVYTERYLGLPSEDMDGYRDFSVVNSAANLKGHLLLIHGSGDDNVHIENTMQFVQKLIEAGIPYDLQIYPDKTHSIAGPDVRTHLYTRILRQFELYLKPEIPAGGGGS